MQRDQLVNAIQQQFFSSKWRIRRQQSLTWEGVSVRVNPSPAYGGFLCFFRKKAVSVTITLDPEKYDLDMLLGCQLILNGGGAVGVARIEGIINAPVLGQVFSLQFLDVPAWCRVKFTLQAN